MGCFCLVWGSRSGISPSCWCRHWIRIPLYSSLSSGPCRVTPDTVNFTSSTVQAFSSKHAQLFLEEINDSRLLTCGKRGTHTVYNIQNVTVLILLQQKQYTFSFIHHHIQFCSSICTSHGYYALHDRQL